MTSSVTFDVCQVQSGGSTLDLGQQLAERLIFALVVDVDSGECQTLRVRKHHGLPLLPP